MDKMIDWKRRKIRQRRLIHLGIAAAIAFGLPLFIAALSIVWRLAAAAVVS